MVRKKSKDLRPVFWAVTTLLAIVLSASTISVFNNQGVVADWIFYAGGGALLALMFMISTGWYTTNETLAFSKRRKR